MAVSWVFLLAYACSGLAGLIYEVTWTRLLTLYIGHSTAAASAVVAAFMGGLAAGAAAGGRAATRLTPRQCLVAYVVLESVVVLAALLLPTELAALRPLLRWSYRNGAPGVLFPAIRLLSCLAVLMIPAVALGATFPVSVRFLEGRTRAAAPAGGALYAVNTAGAAIGALLAGFVLIPAIGVSGSTLVGVAASAAAIAGVLLLTRRDLGTTESRSETAPPARRTARKRKPTEQSGLDAEPSHDPRWLAATVLGVSGFASLMFEIVWTRVLALTVGPTIYAFAATLAALIAGLALGSAAGAWTAGRTRCPAAWLGFAMAAAAIATSWTCSLAGNAVPRYVANEIARSPDLVNHIHTRGAMVMAALILPTAAALGAAFPLALATIGDAAHSAATRFGLVYAINTAGAVGGSLAAGFLVIPIFGLQQTLQAVSLMLVAAGVIVVTWGRLSQTARAIDCTVLVAAAVMSVWSPSWDRALLASGVYLYAPYVAKDLDLETLLKAGTILYYKEGASSTVSVKRLTGTVSLAIDGKVDASNRSDMLTQKLIAHLPLLLHGNPREVCIIGLGSGVTLAAALRHPIAHADVIELSPEVVEASAQFKIENRDALNDRRTRLIVGDGRSHLLLSTRQYDVIVSEPSNPWIAGVASLFTREFFTAVRDRLAPGGIICQWAHTYNISDRDLRSIAATFTSVFPNGTVWLIREGDVLFIASSSALDARLANLERAWSTPDVAEDLPQSSAFEAFELLSLYAGGPAELKQYAADAPVLTDDRMTLEFSGPRELQSGAAGGNALAVTRLLDTGAGPPTVQRARTGASAADWRRRGTMMLKSDANATAYDDYLRAVNLDPSDAEALDGLVQAAIVTSRVTQALGRVTTLSAERPSSPALLVARSKLLAAGGSFEEAVEAARQASSISSAQATALTQIAALYADAGAGVQLDAAVDTLMKAAPNRAASQYYAAVSRFLHGNFAETLRLAGQAVAIDPQYAPVYDLLGAAYTKLGQTDAAREAFEKSLRLNAHDSTAYTNLGVLALSSGDASAAAGYFAEALWLDPQSPSARQGLAKTRTTN
jgi:spermidine synthase